MQTTEVGSVMVDSGMVALVAKKSLKYWTGQDSGDIMGVTFWGRDEKAVAKDLKTHGYQVSHAGRKGFIALTEAELPDFKKIMKSITDEGKIVVTHLVRENSYDRLFLLEPPVAMEVDPNREDEAYVTHTAHGDGGYGVLEVDGAYEVWFEQPPKNTKQLVLDPLGRFELDEPAYYVFVDPCYIEDGDYGFGCSLTLSEGEHDVFVLKNKQDRVVCLVVQ